MNLLLDIDTLKELIWLNSVKSDTMLNLDAI